MLRGIALAYLHARLHTWDDTNTNAHMYASQNVRERPRRAPLHPSLPHSPASPSGLAVTAIATRFVAFRSVRAVAYTQGAGKQFGGAQMLHNRVLLPRPGPDLRPVPAIKKKKPTECAGRHIRGVGGCERLGLPPAARRGRENPAHSLPSRRPGPLAAYGSVTGRNSRLHAAWGLRGRGAAFSVGQRRGPAGGWVPCALPSSLAGSIIPAQAVDANGHRPGRPWRSHRPSTCRQDGHAAPQRFHRATASHAGRISVRALPLTRWNGGPQAAGCAPRRWPDGSPAGPRYAEPLVRRITHHFRLGRAGCGHFDGFVHYP